MAAAIRSIAFNNMGYGHNIQNALNLMRTQQFTTQNDRADVPNVAVLITDAPLPFSSLTTLTEAQLAQQAGIKIFTIGTTSRINITELQLIASQPHLQYHQWWTVDSLSPFATVGLSYIQTMVEEELCRPDYALSCGFTESGGYQCFCQWGYCDTRPMNGTLCVDINECLINNGGCQQLCSNSAGGYSCTCNTGFTLAFDGKTCNDVNECAQTANPCTITSSSCVNSYGGYYCLASGAIASALVGDQPATSTNRLTTSGYPTSTVVLAVLLSITSAVLIIIVSVLIVRHVKLREQPDKSVLVSSAAPARVVGNLKTWGFESIRSKFSVTSDASSVVEDTNRQSPS
jgi:hypothetical protein